MIHLLFLSFLFFLSAFVFLVQAGLTTLQDCLYHLFFQRALHSVSRSPYDMSTTPEVRSIIKKIRSANRYIWGKRKLIFCYIFNIQHCFLLINLDVFCFSV